MGQFTTYGHFRPIFGYFSLSCTILGHPFEFIFILVSIQLRNFDEGTKFEALSFGVIFFVNKLLSSYPAALRSAACFQFFKFSVSNNAAEPKVEETALYFECNPQSCGKNNVFKN